MGINYLEVAHASKSRSALHTQLQEQKRPEKPASLLLPGRSARAPYSLSLLSIDDSRDWVWLPRLADASLEGGAVEWRLEEEERSHSTPLSSRTGVSAKCDGCCCAHFLEDLVCTPTTAPVAISAR